MPDQIQIVKGFQDVLPAEARKWRRLEEKAAEIFSRWGFEEIRLPVVERTELFARGIGAETDIVAKEMFSFPDRKGRSLSLRPEGTAGVVRAYLAAGLGRGAPVRWWYSGPMFRYERPQRGRYRQFHQIGAEAIGYTGPGTDAELIAMLEEWLRAVGLKNLSLELNSLGCSSCRPAYRAALVEFLCGRKGKLCPDCQRRLETNPLRILDCKVPECGQAVAGAPAPVEYLDEACREHFAGVQRDLRAWGIEYHLNPRIVRGLDYYTRTVFEYLAEDGLGAQNAVVAGGRYDGLIEDLGGPATPAAGFALGVERAVLLMGEAGGEWVDYFVVTAGEKARSAGIRLLRTLRRNGCRAEMVLDSSRSMKAQMKAAAGAGAKQVLIIGEEELATGRLTVKDLESGGQRRIEMDWEESEFCPPGLFEEK